LCARECPGIITLDRVVLMTAQSRVKGLARDILESPTSGAIERRASEQLAITTALADPEPAIAPEFALGGEAMGHLDVAAETTGTNDSHPGDLLEECDFAETVWPSGSSVAWPAVAVRLASRQVCNRVYVVLANISPLFSSPAETSRAGSLWPPFLPPNLASDSVLK